MVHLNLFRRAAYFKASVMSRCTSFEWRLFQMRGELSLRGRGVMARQRDTAQRADLRGGHAAGR